MEYEFRFTAWYDYDAACRRNIEFVEGGTGVYVVNPTDGYYAVFESEESAQKPYFKKSQLRKLSKARLLGLCEETFYKSFPAYGDITRAELETELLAVTREEYIRLHGTNNAWRDIEYYDFVAHGYNQGDAAKVANEDNLPWLTREYIEELFFGTPITAHCEVYARAGCYDTYEYVETVYLDEYMDNPYEWNRQAMVSNMEKSADPFARMAAYALKTYPNLIATPTE